MTRPCSYGKQGCPTPCLWLRLKGHGAAKLLSQKLPEKEHRVLPLLLITNHSQETNGRPLSWDGKELPTSPLPPLPPVSSLVSPAQGDQHGGPPGLDTVAGD